MSRKILATYNSDPSAGDDPTKNYVTASDDGTGSSVGLDITQLSGAVSFETNQFSPVPTTTAPTIIKDPDIDGTMSINWSEYLEYPQEIVGVVWTLGAGLTEESNFISATDTLVIYSGGVVDTEYSCTCEITYANTQTAAEDTKLISFTVDCQEIASLGIATSVQLTDTFYS